MALHGSYFDRRGLSDTATPAWLRPSTPLPRRQLEYAGAWPCLTPTYTSVIGSSSPPSRVVTECPANSDRLQAHGLQSNLTYI